MIISTININTVGYLFKEIEKTFKIEKENIYTIENGMIEVLLTDREDIVNCWLQIKPLNNTINAKNIRSANISECDFIVCNNVRNDYFYTVDAEKEMVNISEMNSILKSIDKVSMY